METNILMESGTNELEVLEFTVGNNHYGINVAKIKEIVQYSPVTPVPNSHPCVEGIFMPRDLMITVVDLAKVIKAQPSPDITKDMFIITSFVEKGNRQFISRPPRFPFLFAVFPAPVSRFSTHTSGIFQAPLQSHAVSSVYRHRDRTGFL